MCVTNTVKRRSVVKLSPNSVATSPSIVSQRLWNSLPDSTSYSVEPTVKPVAAHVAFPPYAPRAYHVHHPIHSSDSEHSFPHVAAAPSEEPAKRKRKRKRKPQQPGKTAKMNDRHFVVHDYHDHALEQDVPEHDDESKPRRRGGVATAFPLKLHALLDKIEEDGLAHVVSWQPHGRCFVVHNPKQFVDEVMPKYFRQTRLTSFQRQLNLYGFNRITKGRDNGGYYHELFLRGKVFLSKRMTRTKVKGTRFKAASSPDSEPDFYRMAFVKADPQDQVVVMKQEYEPSAAREITTPAPVVSGVLDSTYHVVSSSSGSEGTMDPEEILEDSLTDTFHYNDEESVNRDDLMLDFAEMWDPEIGTPTPPRITHVLEDLEPTPYGELIENDTQLGELLEAILGE